MAVMLRLKNSPLLVLLFALGACSMQNDVLPNSPAKDEIAGLRVYKKKLKSSTKTTKAPSNNSSYMRQTLSEMEASLSPKDKEGINMTLTAGRLTIAGQLDSSHKLNNLIQQGLQRDCVQEVVSTVLIAGSPDERSEL